MTGKKLAFPENKANVNEYKRLSGKTRKNRKARKTRKIRRA
jgi:hypothetical protein